MKKLFKYTAITSVVVALTACTFAQIKDSYDVYFSSTNQFSHTANGTLNRSGVLNATFEGETFTGQNANNHIEAKGNRGTTMQCDYTMPSDVATGNCKLSNGKTLQFKFQ